MAAGSWSSPGAWAGGADGPGQTTRSGWVRPRFRNATQRDPTGIGGAGWTQVGRHTFEVTLDGGLGATGPAGGVSLVWPAKDMLGRAPAGAAHRGIWRCRVVDGYVPAAASGLRVASGFADAVDLSANRMGAGLDFSAATFARAFGDGTSGQTLAGREFAHYREVEGVHTGYGGAIRNLHVTPVQTDGSGRIAGNSTDCPNPIAVSPWLGTMDYFWLSAWATGAIAGPVTIRARVAYTLIPTTVSPFGELTEE